MRNYIFYFLFLRRCRFFRVLSTIDISSCTESTLYVVFHPCGRFLPCDHELDFDIISLLVRTQSINKQQILLAQCYCVVRVSFHPIYSGRQTCGRTSRGHTGFPPLRFAMHAFTFIAIRIQPSLSLVDREVEFRVPTKQSFFTCWACFVLFLLLRAYIELLICKVHQFGLGCIKNCAL